MSNELSDFWAKYRKVIWWTVGVGVVVTAAFAVAIIL